MKRRAFLGATLSVLLAGCANRLGFADRVKVVEKAVRIHPWDGEPFEAAVRRYDPDSGSITEEYHRDLEEYLDPDEPLSISEELHDRLDANHEIVGYRIRVCEPNGGGDCDITTFLRDDFNEVEVGDIADIVSRSSGAGLMSVHEHRDERE